MKCEECSSNCQTCEGQKNCTSCKEFHILNDRDNGTKKCSVNCPKHTYQLLINGVITCSKLLFNILTFFPN